MITPNPLATHICPKKINRMKQIVLISCVSRKRKTKSKAKDLYISPLFTYSLVYGQTLKPDEIFILSAKHYLLNLETEIEPYDVTLSNVSRKERDNKPNLKVLSKIEKKEWGRIVLEQLSKKANLEKDKFIFLAGQSYIKPIRIELMKRGLNNIYFEEPLKGKKQGERVKLLKDLIKQI